MPVRVLTNSSRVSDKESAGSFGYQAHGLAHADLSRAVYGSISARIVLVETHSALHHDGVCFGRVRVEVDHHTTQIAHGQTNDWSIFVVAKHQPAADPTILAKWFG